MSEEHGRPDLTRFFELFSGPIDVRSITLSGIFVLLVFYSLYFARDFLLPVVLAFLLTFLLAPVVRALHRIRVPQTIGAAIVILAVLSVVVYAVYTLSGPAGDWIARAPDGLRRVEHRIRDLQRPVSEVREVAEQVQERVEEMAGQLRSGTTSADSIRAAWRDLEAAGASPPTDDERLAHEADCRRRDQAVEAQLEYLKRKLGKKD